MADIKYIVIDDSDYHTSIGRHSDVDKMLEDIQNKDLCDIEVYEVKKRVRLEKRPAIIIDEE